MKQGQGKGRETADAGGDVVIIHLGKTVSESELIAVAEYLAACMQLKYPDFNYTES